MSTTSKPEPQALNDLVEMASKFPHLNFVPLVAISSERDPDHWEDFISALAGMLGRLASDAGADCSISAPDLGYALLMLNNLREAFRDVRGGNTWNDFHPNYTD